MQTSQSIYFLRKLNLCFLRNIWWFDPRYIYCSLLFIVVYAWSISPIQYWNLYLVSTKAISTYYLIIYFLSALFFSVGCWLAIPLRHVSAHSCIYLKDTYNWLFVFCVIAYIVWFWGFAMMFGTDALLMFLDPQKMIVHMYLFKESSGRIPGLTSMTELGVVVAPLGMLLYKYTGNKMYRNHLILLLLFALMRSILFSERLAVLEIVVPSFCVLLALKRYKTVYSLLPLIGVLLIYIIFAFFEYGRSWGTHYVNTYEGSFMHFILDRFLGYYTLAINTECIVLEYGSTTYFPMNIFEWIWKIPFVGDVPDLFGAKNGFERLLIRYGNPEFNNPGGMLIGIKDFGLIGLLFSLTIGYIFGMFYKSFRKGSLVGILLYPICILCLLELPRYFYFSSPRAFYVLIAMLIVYYQVVRIRYEK